LNLLKIATILEINNKTSLNICHPEFVFFTIMIYIGKPKAIKILNDEKTFHCLYFGSQSPGNFLQTGKREPSTRSVS
jgi:hypothetical protein